MRLESWHHKYCCSWAGRGADHVVLGSIKFFIFSLGSFSEGPSELGDSLAAGGFIRPLLSGGMFLLDGGSLFLLNLITILGVLLFG